VSAIDADAMSGGFKFAAFEEAGPASDLFRGVRIVILFLHGLFGDRRFAVSRCHYRIPFVVIFICDGLIFIQLRLAAGSSHRSRRLIDKPVQPAVPGTDKLGGKPHGVMGSRCNSLKHFGFIGAGNQKDNGGGLVDDSSRQRDAIQILFGVIHFSNPPLPLPQNACVGKERSRMAVCPQAQKDQIKARAVPRKKIAQQRFVMLRTLPGRFPAHHGVDMARRNRHMIQKQRLRHSGVASGIIQGHAPLIAPKDVHPGPVDLTLIWRPGQKRIGALGSAPPPPGPGRIDRGFSLPHRPAVQKKRQPLGSILPDR